MMKAGEREERKGRGWCLGFYESLRRKAPRDSPRQGGSLLAFSLHFQNESILLLNSLNHEGRPAP